MTHKEAEAGMDRIMRLLFTLQWENARKAGRKRNRDRRPLGKALFSATAGLGAAAAARGDAMSTPKEPYEVFLNRNEQGYLMPAVNACMDHYFEPGRQRRTRIWHFAGRWKSAELAQAADPSGVPEAAWIDPWNGERLPDESAMR